MAWQLKNKGGVEDVRLHVIGKASTQFAKGDLIELITAATGADVAGTGIGQRIASATRYGLGILDAVQTRPDKMRAATDYLTTTAGELLQLIPVAGRAIPVECDVTPYINGVAAQSNTSKTTVIFDSAADAAAAFTGATIYIPELDQHAIVLSGGTKAGNAHTVTVVVIGTEGKIGGAFTSAPSNVTNSATGEILATVRLVPYSPGTVKVKLDATNPHARVSVTPADVGGGHVEIVSVDLARKMIGCLHPALPAV